MSSQAALNNNEQNPTDAKIDGSTPVLSNASLPTAVNQLAVTEPKTDAKPAAAALTQASIAPAAQIQYQFETYDRATLPDIKIAQQVADLFIKSYGHVHERPFLKDPNIFVNEVKDGEMISIVAREPNQNNKIVAHIAVVARGEKVSEIDLLLADPDIRGNSIGSTLRDLAIDKAMQLHASGELDIMRADCVCRHPASQKFAARANFKVTGFFDRKYGDFWGEGDHESIVRLERIMHPAIRDERAVYIPRALYVIADSIYQQHDCKRQIHSRYTGREGFQAEPATFTSYTGEVAAWQALTITATSGVTPYQLLQDSETFFKDGIKHLAIRVNVSNPASIDQINTLRGHGFYFAALEMKAEADYVVMQKHIYAEDRSQRYPKSVMLDHEDARSLVKLIRAEHLSK